VQRKTVTVLFCDVTGSTSLGEKVDPEALRALLARYFDRMKAIVERHGGTVEKFIGDAVMAVFGVPLAHEDDALRAVRAAAEMRDALPELGVQARIGVTTGEVVTGTEERLATGDAVNVAARLEQAAQPGEVLIGELTLALVRGSADVEAVGPLDLKGKAEPVPAYRLLSVRVTPARRHETRFVGRERELALLREAWETAQAERRCELVTILGDAGVGKSRLAAELLQSHEATVVQGRCLSYGEGITYWPVIEVLKQLGVLPVDEAAADAIRSLLGETAVATSAEEIAWAFRKTLERAAAERPLVAVFDDIQWGEQTFLDLVEHVALLSSGTPILLLCMARPELIERRPAWPVTLRLESLPNRDVEELMPAGLAGELREKIARAAGGNPLFITEMIVMAGEADGDVAVPPTLQALLTARLDQLETGERSVLERGAVEGEIFHRGAVQALAPDEPQVTPRLASLVRKELIRPDAPQLSGEDGFRFRHLLIRDAAYDALPKAVRAELHERFVGWLEEHWAALVELDEILGHHLEQAARYKAELGELDPSLAERAAERLAAAGRRALSRGDDRAARVLLERAVSLRRPVRLDVALELDLAWTYAVDFQGNHAEAAAVADRVAERAMAAGDRAGELAARAIAAAQRVAVAVNPAIDELEDLAQRALPLVEEAGDDALAVYVLMALSAVAQFRARYGGEEGEAHIAEQALRHARLAGYPPAQLFGLAGALTYGPLPADEALRKLDSLLSETPHPRPLLFRAWLLAMLGRFEEAWAVGREASERLRELTGNDTGAMHLAEIASLAGDYEAAAAHMRRYCDMLEKQGDRAHLSTYAPELGRALCELRRYDEAEQWAQLGREVGGAGDVMTQMMWRRVQALVLAHRGQHAEAERLAREAIGFAEQTDFLDAQGGALSDLGEVVEAAGRTDDARRAFEKALTRYESKGNVVMAERTRARLAELDAPHRR
jgi:class 3 adenylate cyclase/tetratricopeptide (TPR) repeat protein